MQNGGEPERVNLKINLERYGKGLIKGIKGWTIPNAKLSIRGNQDRFEKVNIKSDKNIEILTEEKDINVVEDTKGDIKLQ
jgi:hypothetical protein